MSTRFPVRPSRRRFSARLSFALIALIAVGSLTGVGCTNTPRPENPVAPGDDAAARLRRAQDLSIRAQDAERAKRPDEAIALYRQAIAEAPNFAAAWNNLGVLLMRQSQNMEAANAFRQAADLDIRDPRPLANLAALWEQQRYFDDAAVFYDQALARDPNYLPALRNSIRVDDQRDIRTEKQRDRIRAALQLETDPIWREYLQRQKQVVDGRLKESASSLGRP